jgi:type IV conjugative transfer system lipoprotein TraV
MIAVMELAEAHRKQPAIGFWVDRKLLMSGVLGMMSLVLPACGHYKSDFSCKGYPDNAVCLSTTQVYERRHEQLTTMKGNEGGTTSSKPALASADRVAAIAGQTEFHMGQPNVSQPVVLQVWVAPWRDSKNNLHEAQIVYAMVEASDWLYGRRPKGVTNQARKQVFTPQLSLGLFEAAGAKGGPNGGTPLLAQPRPATPPVPASMPMAPQMGTSDPSAILRQLQQQMPQLPGTAPGSGAYVPPNQGTDPETAQEEKMERMQEQRERHYNE